ncbi:MAG: class II aldolase/adducin family protein [Acidimicrobiales bacterium]
MDDQFDESRHTIATACRVMAHRGLVQDILGHISLRIDEEHLLVRCRGPEEAGLAFTLPSDVRLVEQSSARIVDDPSEAYTPPSELPLHLAVLRAQPKTKAVVHAHPQDVVAASLAALELVPCVGAYNIPAARLAKAGIPTHPRSVLIRTERLAAEMAASMGGAAAVVLTGHGLVTAGSSVADAVLRALDVQTLARLTLAVNAVGKNTESIPDADFAELPDLGSGFNEITLWRHHVAALTADGLALDQ